MTNPRMYKTFEPWFFIHIFVNLMEKESFTKFYSVCDHFSRNYEDEKFFTVTLCLDVSDVIHASE